MDLVNQRFGELRSHNLYVAPVPNTFGIYNQGPLCGYPISLQGPLTVFSVKLSHRSLPSLKLASEIRHFPNARRPGS